MTHAGSHGWSVAEQEGVQRDGTSWVGNLRVGGSVKKTKPAKQFPPLSKCSRVGLIHCLESGLWGTLLVPVIWRGGGRLLRGTVKMWDSKRASASD